MSNRQLLRRNVLKSLSAAALSSTLPTRLLALGRDPFAQAAAQADPSAATSKAYFNQLGYLPGSRKMVTLALNSSKEGTNAGARGFSSQPNGNKQIVELLSPNSPAVRLGSGPGSPVRDAASGDLLWQIDLTQAMARPGEYRVQVGDFRSSQIRVAPDVYQEALRLTMRAFYGQRCGIAVDLGDGYKHARCHGAGLYHQSSGRSGDAPSIGGWHDAGDYGRYVVNSGISTGTLLWAWELYPQPLRRLHLAIPESGGAIPDFLAEIRWNLLWMLSMQDAADGGVWHKQTSARFCGFVMPEKDTLPSEIIGTGSAPFKNTCATGDFAAVMAIGARCFAPFDAAFAARCLAASRRAFAWCLLFPSVPFRNPEGVTTGEYGDRNCDDEVLWAAAELFRSTGEKAFDQFVINRVRPTLATLAISPPSWGNVRSLGLWTYALAASAARTPDKEISSAINTATRKAASALIERSQRSGYGTTLSTNDYGWGSNSTAANQSLLLLMARRFGGGNDPVEAALGNLHYLLGRNCFGVSWVTQLGTRPFEHPHHRPSAADTLEKPWPGLLSGGPNAHGGDKIADALPPSPPMRKWVDDEQAYSLNEVAINWNAPLVFMLAAFNSDGLHG